MTSRNIIFLFPVILFFIITQSLFAQQAVFIKGADGSVLDEVEQNGGKYFEKGVEKDALTIFRNNGFNTLRLKLWHTPENEYNSLPNILNMAKRAKEKGFLLLLDIQYSDTWADPAHQQKPAAWEGLSFKTLSDSVYEYTKKVIEAFSKQNTPPDMVQIGNEISCGMLWDDGRICGSFINPKQWEQFGTLVKQGIRGVRDGANEGKEISIIIHFDNGGNNFGCQWFFDNLLAQDVDFDIIGLSFYPWWHGTLSDLAFNLNDLATRYQKDIIVVESAYPWTLDWGDNTNNIVGTEDQLLPGYPATVEGQKQFLRDILGIIRNTPENRGKGFVYWSPEWIPGHPGSPWENLALFDFQGEALESMKVFDENTAVPGHFMNKRTLQIFPSPFGDGTSIRFYLAQSEKVTISVVNILGGVCKNLFDGRLPAGGHEIHLNVETLVPGVYRIVLRTDTFVISAPAIKQ